MGVERGGDATRAASFAHVLRRLTFGPFPGAVERALDRHADVHELVDELLDRPPVPFEPPAPIDVPWGTVTEEVLGNAVVIRHWIDRMTDDRAAAHERMMWFWHTLFTTSAQKNHFLSLWHQLRTLHRLATTDLDSLAKALVVDPAMLYFLDGDGTIAQAPNENLSRELMELFLLGRGNYSEADVRAGARGLSGRSVDEATNVAVFHPELGPTAPDAFLGRYEVLDSDTVVEAILEHPACAGHVVGRLWDTFVGTTRDPARLEAWSASFRASGYQLMPLLRTMLHSDDFLRSARSRPRTGIEWFTATKRATGIDDFDMAALLRLGQVPFYPPSVAGWPDVHGWVSPSSTLARAGFLGQTVVQPPDVDRSSDLVADILHWCGVFDATRTTEAALGRLRRAVATEADPSTALLRAALVCPEAVLA